MVTTSSPSRFELTHAAMQRAVDLARTAGAAIMGFYDEPVQVDRKEDRSPITEADRAAHGIIVAGLRDWTPEVPIISEEGDFPSADVRAGWSRFWLVDPLDGTKEFIKHNGEFTVNIALIEAGCPILGVVYAPAMHLLYVAARGLGAWKSEGDGPLVRIQSRRPEPGSPVRIVESRSHPSPELEAYLETIPVGGRLNVGSSIKFCWVAEGKADLYPRMGPTMEWDVAAGDCVFRNSAPEGRERRSPLTYNKPDLRNGSFLLGFEPLPPAVLWFTGLSGAGKSTIAEQVCERLAQRGVAVEYLDGDEIRRVFPATGFTREERDAHIKRVGFLASRLEHHGLVVVASLVSPYESSRQFVRELCRNFLEIHVATPLEECERRDPKGLYKRVREGAVQNFTGVSDPYEAPVNPELRLDTTALTVSQAADRVLAALAASGSRRS